MENKYHFVFFLLVFVQIQPLICLNQYIYIQPNVGRQFDGIGAISGGGATSKLLMNYKEPQRSQILDFLFKPHFGASLHILKVEIGGDSQSTDGAEASHMHSEGDENYQRGYEWWLMTEAKKRNPSLKLYGLPWVFPGWLGGGSFSPYYNRSKLVQYIVNWVQGAKVHHGLDIDYVGVWNERPYDIEYISMLKKTLQKYGNVKTVAGDAMDWRIVDDYINSSTLQKSLDIIGYHYPGSYSPQHAQALPIPLWASEEYSANNNIAGGGCWARVLNEGYVNGLFTGYIAWNLITSYYDNLPYSRSSLMTANQPWSGYYEVNSPIWMSAHHTQFIQPGWHYLKHASGSGNLTGNGTYVSYISPDGKQLTIVIETMDPNTSPCFYPMPKYTVAEEQPLQFKLHAKFVENGKFVLTVNKNEVYTLTTVSSGNKGSYAEPPSPESFPVPYEDDFEGYKEYEEPFNLVQQAGVWEVTKVNDSEHNMVIKQVVPQPPIDTCRPQRMSMPVALIGNYNWADLNVEVDVYIDDPPNGAGGMFLAARVKTGGCWIMYSDGVYFWLFANNNTAMLTGNFTKTVVYKTVNIELHTKKWFSVGLIIQGTNVTCLINGISIMQININNFTSQNGFVAIGTTEFKEVLIDNLKIKTAKEFEKYNKSDWSFYKLLNINRNTHTRNIL